jgi:predicted acetyltransferase
VLEVADPQGHGAGRFRLEAGLDGASCAATTDDADLTVPVGALGAAYLGGTGWARLAAAGWVDEHRAGAVERAAALFTSPRAPWCAMTF